MIRLARNRDRKERSRAESQATTWCFHDHHAVRSLTLLWHGRSWVRKGLEAYYTVLMETVLSKKRILELYANVIELGALSARQEMILTRENGFVLLARTLR
jgi:monofunctional biosynthetic peptidoglycan transglycosylase